MEKETGVFKAGWPKNLGELMTRGDQIDYKYHRFYYLELSHGLMGFFPAVIKNTRKPVVALELDVIREAWKTLPQRQSRVSCGVCYVNEKIGAAFLTTADEEEPSEILTPEKMGELMKIDPRPFEWAPGLIDLIGDMDRRDFFRMVHEETRRVIHVVSAA